MECGADGADRLADGLGVSGHGVRRDPPRRLGRVEMAGVVVRRYPEVGVLQAKAAETREEITHDREYRVPIRLELPDVRSDIDPPIPRPPGARQAIA
jgi:hypothetical protein